MAAWIDAVLVLLVLTNLVLLGSSRLSLCIRVIAIQGLVLGLLPLMVGGPELSVHGLLLAAGTLAIKGILLPWMLRYALNRANVRREVEPFVGFTFSLLIGLVALGVSLYLGARLPPPRAGGSDLVFPVALFSIFVGLFMIVSRRKALTQVIGYLEMENGIYAFGMSLSYDSPFVVEMGILLDVFVGVFVMGIVIFHISREFDHIDTDRLSSLKDGTLRWKRSPLLDATGESLSK